MSALHPMPRQEAVPDHDHVRESADAAGRQALVLEGLGRIMRDSSLNQRADALKATLVFLTPGEVKAFLEVMISEDERSQFEGVEAEVMEERVACVQSSDRKLQLQGLAGLRHLVCKLENATLEAQALLDAHLLPTLIQYLREDECPEVQLEAAWIICNVFSGPASHTRLLVEADVLAALVPLLSSPVVAVRDQALWALGNCAGDSPPMRDAVLLHGILDPLLSTFQPQADITSIRIAVWTLCNCIVRKGVGDLHKAGAWDESSVLSGLSWVLRHVEDKEALTDACWVLRSLFALPTRSLVVEAMASCGITDGLFRLMTTNPSSSTRRHAELTMIKLLGAVGAEEGGEQTRQCMLKAGPLFLTKAKHRLAKVRMYSCRAMAVLLPLQQGARGSDRGRGGSQCMLRLALPTLVDLLEAETDPDTRREALAALHVTLSVTTDYAILQSSNATAQQEQEVEAAGGEDTVVPLVVEAGSQSRHVAARLVGTLNDALQHATTRSGMDRDEGRLDVGCVLLLLDCVVVLLRAVALHPLRPNARHLLRCLHTSLAPRLWDLLRGPPTPPSDSISPSQAYQWPPARHAAVHKVLSTLAELQHHQHQQQHQHHHSQSPRDMHGFDDDSTSTHDGSSPGSAY